MDDNTKNLIQNHIDTNDVCLFMKGTPDQPQCGFSNRAAQVLSQFNIPFAAINVLSDHKAIPSICEWSDFPTMPQIFVHGELIGGSDIALEMFESGELKEMYDAGRQN